MEDKRSFAGSNIAQLSALFLLIFYLHCHGTRHSSSLEVFEGIRDLFGRREAFTVSGQTGALRERWRCAISSSKHSVTWGNVKLHKHHDEILTEIPYRPLKISRDCKRTLLLFTVSAVHTYSFVLVYCFKRVETLWQSARQRRPTLLHIEPATRGFMLCLWGLY